MYYYKLAPLDNEWKATTEHNLDYRSLPGGDYKLSLYAVNKYGVKSDVLVFDFSIATPFWKAGWFYTLLSVLIIAIVIAGFNRRNKITRQRLEEKNRFQKQFAALEQQALQSQMNPHFIFNCLNSIQQYILTNDKQKANEYLTGFAALIRQTLDISAQQKITVAEEASYLTKYIEMERMRFGDSFSYNITIDHAIRTDYIQIPALLLQPYVENCIRHGIRYKTDGKGEIEISFSLKQGNLCCIIRDNGIGRKRAAEFKSGQHIEYQSRGMSLTSKRIQLLNTMDENNISVMVQDLKNDDDTPAGTLVEINITI
jgi:two-component sensor histidine kinase